MCFIREKNKTTWSGQGGGAKKLFNEINEIITYRRKNLRGCDEDSLLRHSFDVRVVIPDSVAKEAQIKKYLSLVLLSSMDI